MLDWTLPHHAAGLGLPLRDKYSVLAASVSHPVGRQLHPDIQVNVDTRNIGGCRSPVRQFGDSSSVPITTIGTSEQPQLCRIGASRVVTTAAPLAGRRRYEP